jgi:hypothetical protein
MWLASSMHTADALRHLLPWQVAAGALGLAALDVAGLLYAG